MTKERAMKLYGMEESSCTQKVLMVLAEKKYEAELVRVDILKCDDKLPEHLKLHPFGEVPVLEDDGFVLYESRAIMRYLDQRLPGPSLSPSDIMMRGLMEQWFSVEQSYLGEPVYDLVMSSSLYDAVLQSAAAVHYPPRPDVARVARAAAEVGRVLDVLDAVLAKQDYLLGSMFSLADINFMPTILYVVAAGRGELLAARTNTAAWWKRVSARPSWAKLGKVIGQNP